MGAYDDLPPANGIETPKTLRQTALRYADRCRRAGYLYWKNDGGLPSGPMYRGRAFHAVAEQLTKSCLEHGEATVDQHMAKSALEDVLQSNLDWVVPSEEMEPLRIMCQHFADHFQMPPTQPLVEQLFHLPVSGSVVSGTVDLAWCEGDTLYLRDYKTSMGGIPTRDEISSKDENGNPKGAKAFQLIVYSLLVADGEAQDTDWKIPAGVNKFDVAFVYPYHVNSDGTGLLERGLVIERPELIEHRAWLESLVHGVEYGFHTGKWPAVPGSHCSQCPSPLECPLPAHLRKVQGISPYERDPSELAEEYFFMREDLKRLLSGLKGYAETHGPIQFGADLELSFKRTDSNRMTKRGKELLEQGVPVPADEYPTSTSTRFDVRPKGSGF